MRCARRNGPCRLLVKHPLTLPQSALVLACRHLPGRAAGHPVLHVAGRRLDAVDVWGLARDGRRPVHAVGRQLAAERLPNSVAAAAAARQGTQWQRDRRAAAKACSCERPRTQRRRRRQRGSAAIQLEQSGGHGHLLRQRAPGTGQGSAPFRSGKRGRGPHQRATGALVWELALGSKTLYCEDID